MTDSLRRQTYCRKPVIVHPIGDLSLLLPRSGQGTPILLPAPLAALALNCVGFRTLEQHAQRLLRLVPQSARRDYVAALVQYGQGSESDGCAPVDWDLSSVAQLLGQLAERGLFVRWNELPLDQARPASAATPISKLGVLTRGADLRSLSCLRSYVENALASGRDVAYTVFDQTGAAGLERPLSELSRERRIPILYVGPGEKERFITRLAARGFSRPVVNFAFHGLPGFEAYGANRNCFLVETAGQLAFSSDDDVICRVAPSPWRADGLCLGRIRTIEDVRCFAVRDEALAAAPEEPADFIGLHERVLGRSVAELIDDTVGPGRSDLDASEVCDEMCGMLLRGAGQVTLSVNGLLGGSPGNDFAHRLLSRGMTDRHGTKGDFGRALDASEIIRAVGRTTIIRLRTMMTTFFAIDGRRQHPPFFPNWHNEDKLFAYMQSSCDPDAVSAFLPYTLLHTPAPRRTATRDRSISGVVYIGLTNLIQAEIAAIGELDLSSEHRLRIIGAVVQRLARSTPATLEARVKRAKCRIIADRITSIERAMAEDDAATEVQEERKRFLLQCTRELSHVDGSVFLGPDTHAHGVEVIGHALTLYGDLLCAWSAILREDAELRAAGNGLARHIGH